MTVDRYLVCGNLAKSLAVVRVTEKYDRIYGVCPSLRDQIHSIMSNLSPLTVPWHTQLGSRTLCHRLSNQRGRVLTSGDTSPREKVLEVGGIIVDPLDGYLSFAKHPDEGINKGRANNIANVAVFRGAVGENEGQVLADAVDQVIFCCAVGDSRNKIRSSGQGAASVTNSRDLLTW